MKKPDFAQKLLDDLRLRKQRLAAANASSASDAHGSTFQRTHQGSRVPNIQETNGRQSRNHARHKSLAIPDSKEIVPIHRAQSSEYISDLSMALSFAIENGGRLGKIHFSSNAMPGKKVLPRHLGTQSIDFSDMNIRYFSDRNRHSNGRFPHLSELHIQEIAKGAQKLNQILKACSNGVNLDAYLIDVGKELLKGAIDLESSLRMLVNLQEASEHTVARQSKRFQLLDGEESEDGEPIADNKLMALDRPRFSFDGSSRNHLKEVAKTSMLKKKLQVLSYPETMNSKQQNSQKQTTMISNSVPHRRSASCDLDSKSTGTFSGTKKDFRSDKLLSPLNSAKVSSNISSPDTKSKSRIKQPKSLSSEKDKGRIPNVIAKLMGIEELPLEIDTQSNGVKKGPESKQESHEVSKKKALRSVKEVNSMILSSEKPVSRINQQMKVLEANKITLPSDAAPETVVTEGKQKRIDLTYLENMNPLLKNSQKPILEIKKKVNLIHMDQMKENKSTKQEEQGRAENAKHKGERNTGKGEQTLGIITQKPVLEFDSQRKISYTHDNSEAEVGEAAKRSPLLNEQKQEIVKEKVPMQSTKQKPIHENESKQQSSIQKPEPKEARHEAAEREQNTKTKLRIKDARSDMMPKSSLKHIQQNNVEKRPLQRKSNRSVSSKKNSSETANTVHPKGHGISTTSESNIQELANGRLEQQRPTYSKAAGEKVAPRNRPIVLLKPPRNLSTKKVENKQVLQTSEKARSIEEERDLKVGSLQTMTRPLKQQTSILQELKQMSNERTSEAKEPIENIPPEISNQHRQQKAALRSPSLELPEDGVELEKREKILTENTKNNVIPSKTFTVLRLPEISSSEDEELKSNTKELPSKGMTNENMIDNCSSIKQRQQSVPKSEEIQEGSLNVHENQLKQILIKSQHFLNAAEAFFNLYIPADILHASYHTQPDKENKLVLDCAYEVMKRKGRREELVSLPPMKISIVSVKVKSFDDLVKELNEDLGHLRVHGKTKDDDHDAAQCLDKILKRDMQSWNPDSNCMWDFGWIDSTCAYLETEEVIKDVEKFVLNRLIDEITKDLLSTSIASFTIPVF